MGQGQAQKKRNPYDAVGRWAAFCAILCFILVIAAQTAAYFEWDIPLAAHSREEFLAEEPLPVSHGAGALFANLRIETAEGISLPSAWVEINGLAAGDFTSGSLLLRVYEGDKLAINTAAYDRSLVFYLKGISSNLRGDLLPQRVETRQGKGEIGTIVFK